MPSRDRETTLTSNSKPSRALPPPKRSELDGSYPEGAPKQLNKNSVKGLITRLKLIEATIDCLYRLGYHRTSTILVAKTAGVSRGSMLNQFPTKADLMIAVSEHIAESRGAAHAAGLEGADTYQEKFRRLAPILWQEMKGPTGVARLELMLASRSDPELGEKFAPLNARLEQSHRKVVWDLAQNLGLTSRELSDAMVQLYAAALRGLAIDFMFGRQATIEDAAVLLESFMSQMVENQDRHVKALDARRAGG
jgi:AcrR family transcriptional regulator